MPCQYTKGLLRSAYAATTGKQQRKENNNLGSYNSFGSAIEKQDSKDHFILKRNTPDVGGTVP
jgi:hypothetical protein